MRSIKKTIERLSAIGETLDDVEYNLEKACDDVQRLITDIEYESDFVKMTRKGVLRGGPNSFDNLKKILDEVKDNNLYKLIEAILLTELALKSYRETMELD